MVPILLLIIIIIMIIITITIITTLTNNKQLPFLGYQKSDQKSKKKYKSLDLE